MPFFGIISEIIPVFSRKPIFGYKGLVAATLGIAALSMSVWAHHMFATGQVLLPFFSFLSFLIAVPTGIKFFNWIGTMWRGQITFETPMLFAIGFLVTFLLGGLSGVLLAAPPIDFHVSDTYFVVAHFHYVLFGTIVFAVYGGVYFWFPKMTGRMLDERLGKVHFWLTFIGFHTTFLVQHWLGAEGMPRRYADYLRVRRLHHAEHDLHRSARSSSARPRCRSSTTSGSRTRPARSSTSTTRGATACRWSGPRRARRRCATSTGCRASAPSGRPSTCTSRTSRPVRIRCRCKPSPVRAGRARSTCSEVVRFDRAPVPAGAGARSRSGGRVAGQAQRRHVSRPAPVRRRRSCVGGQPPDAAGQGEEAVRGIVVAQQFPTAAREQLVELVVGERLVGAKRSAVSGGESGSTGRMEDDEPAARSSDPGQLGQARLGVGQVLHQTGREHRVDAGRRQRQPARVGPHEMPTVTGELDRRHGEHFRRDVDADDRAGVARHSAQRGERPAGAAADVDDRRTARHVRFLRWPARTRGGRRRTSRST